jgi:threonine synthase
MIHCIACHTPYPEDSNPYRCLSCDGIFDFAELPRFDPAMVTNDPGIWRYRHTFGLPADAPVVHLGEGDTPLVWSAAFGREVAFKVEFLNPTSSFKDRGTAVLMSHLLARGVNSAADDSSGNAGSSFAAYARSAGLDAKVFIPAYASGPKRTQIEAYGAEVIAVPGPRSQAAAAVKAATDDGVVYASHAYLPHGLPGYVTVAFELVEQLGVAPGTIITPAGQGHMLLALGRGFEMLKRADKISKLPRLVGVQAQACAPIWAAFTHGRAALQNVREGETLAEGVRTRHPHRLEALINTVKSSHGKFVAVEEDQIQIGRDELAHRGLFVEPTSAIVWDGLQQVIAEMPDPIVVILTGSGLKAT